MPALDREILATYSLTITVSDGTNTSTASTVTINITDINDNTPVITASQTFSINENQASGTTIGTVAVTDADVPTTYSNWTIISGNTNGDLSLNPSTGVLTTTKALDAETTGSYTLTLNVSDGSNISANETITVTVGNLNDNAPVISSGQIFNISEGAAAGSIGEPLRPPMLMGLLPTVVGRLLVETLP